MSAAIPIVHDSPAWHDLRARHVGGSEVAALFDLPADQRPGYMMTRFALWHVKAGNAPPPHVGNPRVAWGLKLEAVIAEAAAETEGWTFDKGGYVSDATTPGLGCTLDFVIHSDPAESGPGALECKNTDWMVHRRSWTDDEPPIHILLQLQHQLAATGYTWGAVAALVGGNDLKIYRYRARPRLIADIRKRVTEFWRSIDEGREPPPDGSDSATAILRALYSSPADEIADMEADIEFADWCKKFREASDGMASANKQRDEAQNHIVSRLGNYQKARSMGYFVNLSIGKATPDRPAKPGEIIKGRKGPRTLHVKETAA